MKKIIILFICFTTMALSGCNSENKVHEDQRMDDTKKVEALNEYNIYSGGILDSGYNWYSKYVYSFVDSLKDSGYKVNKAEYDGQIKKLEQKIYEIKNIDDNMVKKAYDYKLKDLVKDGSKDSQNDDYIHKKIESLKARIKDNKAKLISILESMKQGLELGEDGLYSKDDINKLHDIQINIIKEYDSDLKGKY